MSEKWHIVSNRWVREHEGEAKTHLIMIMDAPALEIIKGVVKGWVPSRKVVCTLDFGYGREDDDEIAAKISATPELLESLIELLPFAASWLEETKPQSEGHPEDERIIKARAAITKAKEIIPCSKKKSEIDK